MGVSGDGGGTRAAQLRMLREQLNDLPRVRVPPGYCLRTYREGDEEGWAELMNTGRLGDWTAERTRDELTGTPQFDPHGLFFLVAPGAAGTVAASACAWTANPQETVTGILHMVCVQPTHRGHRLGYAVSASVLHRLRDRGFQRVALSTDEWRLAAIKTYLQLGFQPVYRHPLHPRVWAAIGERLNWSGPIVPVQERAGEDGGTAG